MSDDRRLIIIAWQPGLTLELDYEGEFDSWEVLAALEEAARMFRDERIEEG